MHANFREWGGGNDSTRNRRKPLPLRHPHRYRDPEKFRINILKYFAPFAGNLPSEHSRLFACIRGQSPRYRDSEKRHISIPKYFASFAPFAGNLPSEHSRLFACIRGQLLSRDPVDEEPVQCDAADHRQMEQLVPAEHTGDDLENSRTCHRPL